MKKFKKIIALLLSLAMIEGSIYTSNSYFYAARESASSLKINRGIQEALLKSLKASNSDAENENIVTDGDVAYDLATASKAKTENIEDGDILSIASAGNALLSLATASNVDKIVNRSAVSCIKLESVDGTISDPDDFAIGKSGTRNIRLRWIIAPSDIKNMQTPEDVAVEIFIPNGFVPDTTTLETDASWESSYSTISEGTIIILRYVGSSFNDTLNQSIMVVQNAKTLLDNLSTQNTYEFSAKLYNNYENSNKALVVKTEAADKTDGFSFNADNTTPTWDVSTENNDTTWKPRQIIKDWHNSASSDWSTKGSYTTFNYDKKLIVRYEKKDKGYISGDVSFNFPIETLPLYTVNSKQYYQIYASYTDEYGNVLYFNDQAVTESSSYFDVCDGQWVFDAGAIANMADSGDFKTNADGYTYGEILYNKGTFEIQVMPCLYFNRLFFFIRIIFI